MQKTKKFLAVIISVCMIVCLSSCKGLDTSSSDEDSLESNLGEVTSSIDSSSDNDVETVTPTVTGKGPVSYYGELKASGNKIIGSKTNRQASVTGMSFFWSNWSQSFYTKDKVKKMKNEYNCEIVRAAYGIQDNGTPYNSSDEALIRTLVEGAIDNDIYVIIDWHSHGAHNNVNEAKKFFEKMAKDYGKYDNVIFELYNEPLQMDWNTVKQYAEQVIPVIRQYSDNLIVVGTTTWSQDVDIAANNPVKGTNIAYTLHFYAGTHRQDLRNKAENALSKNVALFVTEWGSVSADGNGAIDYASTQEWINWMNKKGLSFCNWAVNDKNETSSIFKPDGSYTEAGKFLRDIITRQTKNAEWKTGKPQTHENYTFNPSDYK